jgi:hypothetical protein
MNDSPLRTEQVVLTKAVIKAAQFLGFSRPLLARVLGVSRASVSGFARGTRSMAPESKRGELGMLLVRLYQSLDALVGGNEAQCKAWMRCYNRPLNGRPLDLIARVEGLVSVVVYL